MDSMMTKTSRGDGAEKIFKLTPSRPAPSPPSTNNRTFPHKTPPPLPPPPAQLLPFPPSAQRPATSHADTPSPTAASITQTLTRGRTSSISDFVHRASGHSVPITRSHTKNGRSKIMLRKHKVRDQEEALRQEKLLSEREPPPQIPPTPFMPVIDDFGGSDNRPTSAAIFAGKTGPGPIPQQANKNFSRPGFMTASSSMVSLDPLPSYSHLHSSPSEASRNGVKSSPLAPKAESMANRGRESYSSLALGVNSPRRTRKRKDPTPFNILILGAKNSGKTAFAEFLRTSLAPQKSNETKIPGSKTTSPDRNAPTLEPAFAPSYLDTEVDGERVGLTIWDSKGLERNIVDLQLREISAFIESKFEETFAEEQKVVRSPSAKDTHIHCVLLIIDPVRLDSGDSRNTSGLKNSVLSALDQAQEEDLDLQVMRALAGKTTVIPIISKADTLTGAHMSALKRSVWDSIQAAKLDPLEALGLEEDSDQDEEEDDDSRSSDESDAYEIDEHTPSRAKSRLYINGVSDDSSMIDGYAPGYSTAETTPSPNNLNVNVKANRRISRVLSPIPQSHSNSDHDSFYIPFSILSPDPYASSRTRIFPWGEADPLNPKHCDFLRLKDSIFGEWRSELREASREKWYEGWRTSRLNRMPSGAIGSMKVRQAGGVTPARAIPKGGRTSPISTRKTSGAADDHRARVSSFSSVQRGVAAAADDHRARISSFSNGKRGFDGPRSTVKAHRVLGDPTGQAM